MLPHFYIYLLSKEKRKGCICREGKGEKQRGRERWREHGERGYYRGGCRPTVFDLYDVTRVKDAPHIYNTKSAFAPSTTNAVKDHCKFHVG